LVISDFFSPMAIDHTHKYIYIYIYPLCIHIPIVSGCVSPMAVAMLRSPRQTCSGHHWAALRALRCCSDGDVSHCWLTWFSISITWLWNDYYDDYKMIIVIEYDWDLPWTLTWHRGSRHIFYHSLPFPSPKMRRWSLASLFFGGIGWLSSEQDRWEWINHDQPSGIFRRRPKDGSCWVQETMVKIC